MIIGLYLDDFSLLGKLESNRINLETFNDLLNVDFKNFSTEDLNPIVPLHCVGTTSI